MKEGQILTLFTRTGQSKNANFQHYYLFPLESDNINGQLFYKKRGKSVKLSGNIWRSGRESAGASRLVKGIYIIYIILHHPQKKSR